MKQLTIKQGWDFDAMSSFFLVSQNIGKQKCVQNDTDYFNVSFILHFLTNLTFKDNFMQVQ